MTLPASKVMLAACTAVRDAFAEHPFDPSVMFSGPSAAVVVEAVLDAIPDGWAKIDGEWVLLRADEDGIGDRCYYADQA